MKNLKLVRILSLVLALTLCLGLFVPAVKAEEGKKEEAVEEAAEEVKEEVKEGEEEAEEAKDEEADAESSATEIKEGGTFVVATNKELGTYNPSFGNPDEGYMVVQNIFNKLVKMNGDFNIVPDLAESWEFSEDGLTLTFHLHEGIKWHDGEDFTSEDVKFTFEKAKEVEGYASQLIEKFKEINCPDENTVEIVLAEPDATVLGGIGYMGTYIMPKHIFEDTDVLENPAIHEPIGTGPFKLVEQEGGEVVVLEKNEDFFGEGPYLDKVIFKVIPEQMAAHQAWLAGEIDDNRLGVPAEEQEAVAEMEDVVSFPMTFPNMAGVVFNMEEGPFADVKAREAVLYGIDAPDLMERVFKNQGSVAEYFIPYQYAWALNEDVVHPARDVEKAISLLEEAGLEKDEEGFFFTATVVTYPGWDGFVPVLKAQLEEIGIKLEHDSLDDPTYDQRVLEDFDFDLTLLGGFIGPNITALNNKYMTGGVMNYGHYSNEKVDELLKAAMVEPDMEKAAELYKEVQSIVREDLPIVYFRNFGYTGFLKDYIKGHPSNESKETSSEYELTSVWLDKEEE